MATLTPTQVELLTGERTRKALGEPLDEEIATAVEGGALDDDGTVTVDLTPWRDAISAALREVGPDSVDSTEMEAVDNLVKQLSS
jgi:hypothetical protein